MDSANELDLSLVAELLRKLKGLTIAELARRADVNRPALTIWLGGRKKVLSQERQDRVCDRLDWRYGGLVQSRIHTWVLRDRDDIITLQKAVKLILAPNSELRVASAIHKVTRVGSLVFVVPPEGTSTMVRIRRDLPEHLNKGLNLCALLDAQLADSHYMSNEEFAEIWQKDEVKKTPRDYLDWYHRDRSLSTALDRDADAWRYHQPESNPNEEESSFTAGADELPTYSLDAYPPIPELTIADLEEEALAREDYNWRPMIRELQKLGISPQEVRKMLQPHLELIELREKLARYEGRAER